MHLNFQNMDFIFYSKYVKTEVFTSIATPLIFDKKTTNEK